MARIPLARLEPVDGQRPLIQATLDGIYDSLSEDNAAMRDVYPLGVIVARGDAMDEFKRRLSEQSLDRVLSFEGIPEEYRLKVYSGLHRFTAATRYVEAHQGDPEPPSAAMRSWLCVVYSADVADDPDLPLLMVAHNIEGIRSTASIKEWIHCLQFSGNDPKRIKTAIGLTAQGPTITGLCAVRSSMLWEQLVIYGTLEFNKTLNMSIIASWAAYCPEFEILKILLEDAVRQQTHIATLKKFNLPLTPFDIFGQVWGEKGHKQSGDKMNVKKDWKNAEIRGFGTVDSTFSFTAFWKKAILEKEYLFGNVILVPEDLRGDPKGGKRKDMPGYVILTRTRAALSCLSTLLFAGNFEYRCIRSSLAIPKPWVATIMEKQGVDKRHVDEFIRDLVPRIKALVADNQMKGELPHYAAHDIFIRKGRNDRTLRRMVWKEVIKKGCYAAWDKFLLHCEENFNFKRDHDLWDIITEIAKPKAGIRKNARQKASHAAATVNDKVPSTKEGGSRGRRRQTMLSSSDSDSDKEVVIKTRRGAGKQPTSKGELAPRNTRNSTRLAGIVTSKPVVEYDEDDDNEEEDEDEEDDSMNMNDSQSRTKTERDGNDNNSHEDDDDENEEQLLESSKQLIKHVEDSDTGMQEDKPLEDVPMRDDEDFPVKEGGYVPDDGDVRMEYYHDLGQDNETIDYDRIGGANANKDMVETELFVTRAGIDSELARWKTIGSGSEALELLKSLHKQLTLGP